MTLARAMRIALAMACALTGAAASQEAAASPGGTMGRSRFVDVDGIRTRYFERGEGEPMVLIHGGHFGLSGAAAFNWMPIVPPLAEHYRVIALDKLGMGLTGNPTDDAGYRMEGTTAHLLAFLRTLDLEGVHLVGHSRGGLPAMTVALDHPELVRSVTIFDSGSLAPGEREPKFPDLFPERPPPTRDSIRRLVERLIRPPAFHRTDFVTDEWIDAWYEAASQPKAREAALRFEALRRRWVEEHPDQVRARPLLAHNSGDGWWMIDAKEKALARIEARELSVPTLLVWGSEDTFVPLEAGLELYRLVGESVAHARFHAFNRCGHAPFQEYPEEAAQVMVTFLEQSPGR